MSIRHRLARPWLALHRLFGARSGLRLLLLHEVAAADLPALERLVGWLAESGRLGRPAEIEAVLAGGAPPKGPRWVISFDDGFAGNSAAARVVARAGGRALLFVCPGLIDLDAPAQRRAIAANIFDGGPAPDGLRLLDWDDLAGLARDGHVIASHTFGHRRLSTLGAERIAAEIGGAADLLTERLGGGNDWFAYPFGDIDSISAEALAIIGRHHRFCRSGVRGAITAATHRLAVPAEQIDLAAPWAYQQLVAEGGLDARYGAARARLAAMVPP